MREDNGGGGKYFVFLPPSPRHSVKLCAPLQSSAGQEEMSGDATAECATSTQPMQLLGQAVSCRTMTSPCSQPPEHVGEQHTLLVLRFQLYTLLWEGDLCTAELLNT